MLPNKNLTVLTICLHQTQGDSSAALKLIQGIVRSNEGAQQKINVTWIFAVQNKTADLPFYITFIQLAQQIGVHVIFTDQEMSDVGDLVISNSDFFLYFPYVSSIPRNIVLKLKNSEKPVLNISEYNLDQIDGALRTGFGANRLGVFVEDEIDPSKHTLTSCKDVALEKIGLMDAETATVSPENVEQYKKNHMLFFGYFNKEFNRSNNHSVVNPQNFIAICLCLAILKKAKNVDLVVRLGGEVKDFPLQFLAVAYSSIEIISRDGKASKTQLNSDQSLPKIRIIDPFPLGHDAFKLLMSIAEPFIALTGDQSFTEGINRSGIIFYQIMSWKQQLADAFKKLCSDLPTSVEICAFNNVVLSKHSKFSYSRCFELAKFIFDNESKLIAQMRTVKQKVHKTYNLLENLIPRLRAVVINPDLMDRALGDYRYSKNQEASQYQSTTQHDMAYHMSYIEPIIDNIKPIIYYKVENINLEIKNYKPKMIW